jgi:FKBP-type peptidyl-prolyl cis-trans isomerase 2
MLIYDRRLRRTHKIDAFGGNLGLLIDIIKKQIFHMITKGNTVEVHYTGKFVDGEVFDSSEGNDPLQFEVGSGQIIPGFENAILGKQIGEKVTVRVSPEEAYGAVREDLVVEVPVDKMPGQVEVGQLLQADSGDGQTVQVIVREVKEDVIVIDGNHPLAGQELIFDIEVVSIQ